MRLIDADVADIRPLPCLSRVEADVRLVYAATRGGPAQERTVRTSAPLEDSRNRPIRVRLVADALQLALRAGNEAPAPQDAAA